MNMHMKGNPWHAFLR